MTGKGPLAFSTSAAAWSWLRFQFATHKFTPVVIPAAISALTRGVTFDADVYTAGCRCPGLAAALNAALAAGYHRHASAFVAAPRSTSRTSASWSEPLSWQMRTPLGWACQSPAVHRMSAEPVVYPAVCPGGRWEMLAWMASWPMTTLMRFLPLSDPLGHQDRPGHHGGVGAARGVLRPGERAGSGGAGGAE